ncbi:MAG: hypothetical protein ACOCQG_04500 [Candidatus Nanoarchaeia archaeon]
MKKTKEIIQFLKLKSDFSTSVSLVAMWNNQGPKKPTRAVGEHATSL